MLTGFVATHPRIKTRPFTTTLSSATVCWLSESMIVALIDFYKWLSFFLNFVSSHFQAMFVLGISMYSGRFFWYNSSISLAISSASCRVNRSGKNLCIKSSNSHLIESMTSIKSSLFVNEILYIIYIILYIIYIIDYRYYTYLKYIKLYIYNYIYNT